MSLIFNSQKTEGDITVCVLKANFPDESKSSAAQLSLDLLSSILSTSDATESTDSQKTHTTMSYFTISFTKQQP